ncbi:hypothetical protein GSI_05926 [Ganoderma sinense ZZ0214-1]|uniref:Uncharacterized protein n=1 Tax=Ganoderma sinense ZZ0214-1 TaxID=1077348 RepID=A0A2G8SCB0_9APHY|nr:hypothetical protein GSI_05926 [Ganoderma sinense ZZ0214-1]
MAGTEALAQHPPAMKVAGRRLSLNSRPRPPTTTLYVIPPANAGGIYCGVLTIGVPRPKPKPQTRPKSKHSDAPKTSPPPADTPPDYPRPAAPGEQQVHHHQQQQQEEEVPKRKHGSGGDEHERRIQESLYRKAEQNRPKKELSTGPKVANRISQPAGKTLGA